MIELSGRRRPHLPVAHRTNTNKVVWYIPLKCKGHHWAASLDSTWSERHTTVHALQRCKFYISPSSTSACGGYAHTTCRGATSCAVSSCDAGRGWANNIAIEILVTYLIRLNVTSRTSGLKLDAVRSTPQSGTIPCFWKVLSHCVWIYQRGCANLIIFSVKFIRGMHYIAVSDCNDQLLQINSYHTVSYALQAHPMQRWMADIPLSVICSTFLRCSFLFPSSTILIMFCILLFPRLAKAFGKWLLLRCYYAQR